MAAENSPTLPVPPGPIPEPPADLGDRRLPLLEIAGATWYRGHRVEHGPIYFNRVRGRWSDPEQTFGALYLGVAPECSFIEAFNQQIRRSSWGVFVSERLLAAGCLCPVTVAHPLRLVDLTTGPQLRTVGADNRICDGPHDVSRRWARAFWAHPDRPDGIQYRSRHAPELFSIALFDRPGIETATDCSKSLLLDRDRLSTILDYFDCALLP